MKAKHLPSAVLTVAMCIGALPGAVFGLGEASYVSRDAATPGFQLAGSDGVATLYVDAEDHAGVVRAVGDLRADINRVTGRMPAIALNVADSGSNPIIVGTLGRSRVIDRLVADGRIDVTEIRGKWESYVIETLSNPLPGVASGLVIAGSDKRGTIFGVYDLSEQIGVSPWYWWADVPIKQSETLVVHDGRRVEGPPAVQYRGIFLNDEAPALSGWADEEFGDFNSAFYTKVFELILRLKGNFLWPAMWDNSFNTDDSLNPRLADEYGIVMSTSHHEPMMRAWKEWEREGHGHGTWDYAKSEDALRAFWEAGMERSKDYEQIITLAMRGDGDEPMSEDANVALLERIVEDQRKIIADKIHPDVTAVPQVWALYKEVQGYYERGMRVPDDVILLWCDDNWGNIRRLPTEEERARSGGAGVYYHFDYVGGPRSYRWINTVPISKVWEQMNLAHQYGANRIWIVNVGDLKPMEFPIEFFLSMAWDPDRWPKERIADFGRLWAEREFGPAHASEIADIVSKYTQYNGRRKPELLAPTTYSLIHYREADRIVGEWLAIAEQAEAIYERLPDEAKDAFFQLVLYPAKAGAQVAELWVALGKNRLYAEQGRASANDVAQRVRDLFEADAALERAYHRDVADGKWNHMMAQSRIGYTSWRAPDRNVLPEVTEITVPVPAAMGVSVEGSASAWPGGPGQPALPAIDVYNQPSRYIDVFNRGQTPFEFSAEASAPWIRLAETGGTIEKEQRLWVRVDWDAVPTGTTDASVILSGTGADPVTVSVRAVHPDAPTRESARGFVEADGVVSIEAAHYSRKVDVGPVRWEGLGDYGRTESGMTIFPVTAESVTPPDQSPYLAYDLHLFSPGDAKVTSIISPTLNFAPDRGLRFGVSIDDEEPQVLTAVPQGFNADNWNQDWEESVRFGGRRITSTHHIDTPGDHTLKVWMVDPGVVLQKIVVDLGGEKPSYLGPPESFRGVPMASALD